MSRPGAILIPLLGGFLLTVGVVSWRSGWWQRPGALEFSAATPPQIGPRRSPLRVVHVTLSSDPWAPVAAVTPHAPSAPKGAPHPAPASLAPPPLPAVNPGSSPQLLEAPARKFARGGKADGN